jgi:26S proteasome regulatory subunit N3
VSSLEPRFATRALRKTSSYRHSLTVEILEQEAIRTVKDQTLKSSLLESIKAKITNSVSPTETVPEIEIFIGLLVVFYLFDQKQFQTGGSTCLNLIERCKLLNRRTLDPIQARLFFFYSLFSEKQGKLTEIQPFVITSHRTATLRQDNDTRVE